MTGRQRLLLALLLAAAALLAGVAVALLTPYAFSCHRSSLGLADGGVPAGSCCLRVPCAVVDAVELVVGGLIGAACVSCFYWFAYHDELTTAAKKAGDYVAIRDDAEAGKN